MDLDRFATLLDGPSPAVLTTYRRNGTAVASPVWYRRTQGSLEVVIADGDPKVGHLARRPECALVIFEAVPPFRAVRVEGAASLDRDSVVETRRGISRRYLGVGAGDEFTDARGPGVVVRLPLATARAWDLAAILPGTAERPGGDPQRTT